MDLQRLLNLLNINNKNIAHISFAHSNILSSGYDLFADLERYTKNEDNDDIFYTKDDKNIDVSAKIKEEIEQIKQKSTSWIKWLLIIGLKKLSSVINSEKAFFLIAFCLPHRYLPPILSCFIVQAGLLEAFF